MRGEAKSGSNDLCLREINSPWREILHQGRKLLLPRGHREACGGSHFYLILSGLVRLDFAERAGWCGSSLYMGPGCLFNEVPILHMDPVTHAEFICMLDTEAWAFPGDLLSDEEFFAEHPRLAINLMRSLAGKADGFFTHLMYARGASALCRICGMLVRLAGAGGAQRMSQSELAMMLGLHPTTVARHVRTLRERGVIGAFTKSRLEVLDMDELHRLAQL